MNKHPGKNQLEYTSLKPDDSLKNVVESIWMLKNHSGERLNSVIVPDGKIDLFLFSGEEEKFEIFMSGICTDPVMKPPFPNSTMFAISFYPIAAEYIFSQSVAELRNKKQMLSSNYWDFSKSDLDNFEHFYAKACKTISSLMTKETDRRKVMLFEMIDASKGETTVKELSEKVGWSSRQINRYFHNWLGITLKSYIRIIRFSNSLEPLTNGEFYPKGNYVDQSHFIREVKKFSGVKPTVLNKNENDRFIQLKLMSGT